MFSKKFVGFSSLVIFFLTLTFISFNLLFDFLYDKVFGLFSSFEILFLGILSFTFLSIDFVLYFIFKNYFSKLVGVIFVIISLFISTILTFSLGYLSLSSFYLIFVVISLFIFYHFSKQDRYFNLDKLIILNSYVLIILGVLFSTIFFIAYDDSGFVDEYLIIIDKMNEQSGSIIVPYKLDAYEQGFITGYIESCQKNEIVNCKDFDEFFDDFNRYLKDTEDDKLFDVKAYKAVLAKSFQEDYSFKILKLIYSVVISFIILFCSIVSSIFVVIHYYILEYLIKLLSWILDPLNLEKY